MGALYQFGGVSSKNSPQIPDSHEVGWEGPIWGQSDVITNAISVPPIMIPQFLEPCCFCYVALRRQDPLKTRPRSDNPTVKTPAEISSGDMKNRLFACNPESAILAPRSGIAKRKLAADRDRDPELPLILGRFAFDPTAKRMVTSHDLDTFGARLAREITVPKYEEKTGVVITPRRPAIGGSSGGNARATLNPFP